MYLFSFTKNSQRFAFRLFSQESPQQHVDQNNVAMDLINSVTGVDEEGRSRQRILAFAAQRYRHLILLSQPLCIFKFCLTLNKSYKWVYMGTILCFKALA